MGIRPMLADTADPDRITSYLGSDDWLTQPKADGQRYLIEMTEGQPMVWNRAGQPKVSNISHSILAEFEKFKTGHWCFDGEYVATPDENTAGRLVLFDLPVAEGCVEFTTPFETRLQALELLMPDWNPDPQQVLLLPCARTPKAKLDMLHDADVNHREGIMLRHRLGHYRPGTRSAQLLKHKFVKELDAIITEVGRQGKDNAVLSLIDPRGEGRIVEVGTASTIGKKPVPQVGDVWMVRFLYVLDPESPKLYQPRLMQKRDDKGYDECLFDQLTHAWTNKDLGDGTKTREEM